MKKLAYNSTLKKTKVITSGPTPSWQIEGEKVEAVIFFFSSWADCACTILQIVTAAMTLKDVCFLEGGL